ncbi:hypothetical protein MOU97_000605 [Vibrio vulnificus]|nr:hypothetical protein [Vibrio vulnificus]EIV1773527.1 hypothetical protein [Vibrio vulnificus]EIZ0988567.1 hypothetical protein [Vibrio vulnificus]ELX4145378.1 hypothetical protein [Vibrio vulnificus]
MANIYKHRATPSIAVILANAGIHLPVRTEQCVGERPYIDKCRESKVNAVVPSTQNARFGITRGSQEKGVRDKQENPLEHGNL